MTPAKSERETTAVKWPQLVASGGGLRAKLAEKTISFDIPSGISTGRANASSSWSLCCGGLRRAPAPAGRSELGRAARTATGSQRVPLACGWLAASMRRELAIAKAGAIMKGQINAAASYRPVESKLKLQARTESLAPNDWQKKALTSPARHHDEDRFPVRVRARHGWGDPVFQ
eukprot:COSAG06_NODE_6776_length_2765_cov_3.468006_2_plen_174_part_00